MSDQPVCAACGSPTKRGEPTFFFDDERYHLGCVPAEHAGRAQALLGVKGC